MLAFQETLDDEELPEEVVSNASHELAKVDGGALEVPDGFSKMTVVERRELIQDMLMRRSGEVLESALCFAEISPEDTDPPRKWVEDLGAERAAMRFRVAKAAWANSKAAPFGISVAKSLFAAITKIDAARAQPTSPLNAAIKININAPAFEEIDVE